MELRISKAVTLTSDDFFFAMPHHTYALKQGARLALFKLTHDRLMHSPCSIASTLRLAHRVSAAENPPLGDFLVRLL